MANEIKIIIPGHPATKKNSLQIILNKKTKRYFPIQSKIYREYEKHALRWLSTLNNICFIEPIMMTCQYWVKDNRKRDLINLLAATSDILEKAGIVADDCLVVSVDGSRIVDVDRDNPRVEITLREVK